MSKGTSVHSQRDCEKSRKHGKRKFLLCLYVGYFSREKTPIPKGLKAMTVRLIKKRVQSIIIDKDEAALFQEDSQSNFHLLLMR